MPLRGEDGGYVEITAFRRRLSGFYWYISRAKRDIICGIFPEVTAKRDNYLVEALCTLVDHEVQFVVAGGVAAVLHGVERMTLDLDVAVSLDRANLERFLTALRKLELEPRAPVPAEFILQPARIDQLIREKNALVFTFWSPREPYRQIDMFLTRENSFDYLVADAQELSINGRTIRFASRQKLIDMKRRVQPVRQKDLSDIQALKKIEEKEQQRDEGRP